MPKLPWFPFWVDDFLSDENVLVMTNEEVGIYVKLLCHQWKAGSIPSDFLPMAKLCGTNADALAAHWQQIGKCFGGVSGNSGRLTNPRLEREREKQQNKRKARSEAGLRGADARWKPDGNAIDLPMAKNGELESELEEEDTTTTLSPGGDLDSAGDDPPKKKPKAPRQTKYTLEFEKWWNLYPKNNGSKFAAFKAWEIHVKPILNELVPDDMTEAVEAQITYKAEMDKRGEFCAEFPHGERWLKQRRWENKPEVPQNDGTRLETELERKNREYFARRRAEAEDGGGGPGRVD